MQFYCTVCKHASNDPTLASVDSIPEVRNSLIGCCRTLFCCAVSVWNFFGRPVAIKKGLSWENGFAIGDANTKIVPKMPYFPD